MAMGVFVVVVILGVFCFIEAHGMGYLNNPNGYLPEDSSCHTTSGLRGRCKKINHCPVYSHALSERTMEYNNLFICSFDGLIEVVCCPNHAPVIAPPNSLNVVDRVYLGSSQTIKPIVTKMFSGNDESDEDVDDWVDPLITNAAPPTTPRAIVEVEIVRKDNERMTEAACRTYNELNPGMIGVNILDGEPVQLGDYPHMGALIYKSADGNSEQLRCGASLISQRYALTAAHCVIRPDSQPSIVRFGVLTWNAQNDLVRPVDAEIENITIHPEYRANTLYHDVALIRLRQLIGITRFVRPACLYTHLEDLNLRQKLVVTGWGFTNVATREMSDDLLMANVSTVPLSMCNITAFVKVQRSRALRHGLNMGHYCAFDPMHTKDACEADSGGPLQLMENGVSTIVGVISFGVSCATSTPSVYTRVAYYLDWIESIVWPL